MNSQARWRGKPRVQRTRRPTAWRKNSSVAVVVAYTPTRSRGMSTPSETIRTATSHGSEDVANRAISSDASGSSDVTSRADVPNRIRSSAAIPRACSRSVAITSPAASGCSFRTSTRRSFAALRTAGSHSPSSESAVRSRWPTWAPSSRSSNVAEWTAPSGAVHSICPFVVGKKTGRTTRRSSSASP